MFFDPWYFVFIAPAVVLGLWAQWRVRSTYAQASQEPARMSGAQAAELVLRSAGLADVRIEEIGGQLSDHYDPRARTLRLSHDVYRGHSMAAVGIAAHEAGHALQHAQAYAPLVIRNAAVPAANFGASFGVLVIIGGAIFHAPTVIWIGIALFAAVAFFQLVNLPVEFDASARAKEQLVSLGVVPAMEMQAVNRVLSAAAWTYVAATLQTLLVLMYYIWRFAGASRSNN